MAAKLSEAEVKAAMRTLPEWSEINDEIQRTFKFDDFARAMAFVNRVADAAEAMQHHPDVLIRYNKVTLTLTTHDAGGVTELDVQLAKAADGFAGV